MLPECPEISDILPEMGGGVYYLGYDLGSNPSAIEKNQDASRKLDLLIQP